MNTSHCFVQNIKNMCIHRYVSAIIFTVSLEIILRKLMCLFVNCMYTLWKLQLCHDGLVSWHQYLLRIGSFIYHWHWFSKFILSERERERNLLSAGSFHQMPAITRVGQCQSQEHETELGSSIRVAVTPTLEKTFAVPQVLNQQEAGLEEE